MSIKPNYDFTVYNMKEEPIVRTVEKYYGGDKSCYFSCVSKTKAKNADGTEKIDEVEYLREVSENINKIKVKRKIRFLVLL